MKNIALRGLFADYVHRNARRKRSFSERRASGMLIRLSARFCASCGKAPEIRVDNSATGCAGEGGYFPRDPP
jgi:hypothetical protein